MSDTKPTTKYSYALGRRKNAVATVRLFEGKGESMVNDKPFAQAYPLERDRFDILRPLAIIERKDGFFFTAKTAGGGVAGQKDAIRLALARAIVEFDASLKTVLKKEKMLTRDPRMVERKKTGYRKARKAEQYSKR